MRARTLWLLLPAVVVAAAAVLPVDWESPVPLCLVRTITGHTCPGCGMTRAFLLIGHGRVAEAFRAHPASPLAFLIVAGYAVTGLVRVASEKSLRGAQRRGNLPETERQEGLKG